MEFYAEAAVPLSAGELQKHICLSNLPQWCASIERVLMHRAAHVRRPEAGVAWRGGVEVCHTGAGRYPGE